jgi:PHD/YefM family antitoxin component YafN of YafNO toxin-antitoxin module
MTVPKERYVTDDKGNKIAIILELSEYQRILEELEELESIRAFDAAKNSQEDLIPFEDAIKEIKRDR